MSTLSKAIFRFDKKPRQILGSFAINNWLVYFRVMLNNGRSKLLENKAYFAYQKMISVRLEYAGITLAIVEKP